jgi:protein-L-isoaspartate(D-aspartate) O-methyltransferase
MNIISLEKKMKCIIFITIIIALYLILYNCIPFSHLVSSDSKIFAKGNIESIGEDYVEKRKEMVDRQIIARGVRDKKVLEVMQNVPRHLFVPEGYREYSYYDQPLPIGLGQTISQPYIVALMTEMLSVDKDDVVLEIGTGSGYQAAVLSEIVKEVYTIELIEELGLKAEKRLKSLGYKNVYIRIADGSLGWPDKAPFDAIMVTAAAGKIPDPLVKQLKPGGRMVIPVDSSFLGQDLLIVEKDENGKVSIEKTIPVRFVPLIEEEEVVK